MGGSCILVPGMKTGKAYRGASDGHLLKFGSKMGKSICKSIDFFMFSLTTLGSKMGTSTFDGCSGFKGY